MIKRDKRNIGKLIRINQPGTVMHNRIGKVMRFRGDHSRGNPFVQVFIYDLNSDKGSAYPFPGNRLGTLTETKRHKWLSIDWRGIYVRCRHCGLEVKASQAKRGVGKCPGNKL